jgi:hypothetical protein
MGTPASTDAPAPRRMTVPSAIGMAPVLAGEAAKELSGPPRCGRWPAQSAKAVLGQRLTSTRDRRRPCQPEAPADECVHVAAISLPAIATATERASAGPTPDSHNATVAISGSARIGGMGMAMQRPADIGASDPAHMGTSYLLAHKRSAASRVVVLQASTSGLPA